MDSLMAGPLGAAEIPEKFAVRSERPVEAVWSLTDDSVRFTELVERQSRFVYRVAYAVVRQVQDAEDVVQETFLKLYRTGAWEEMVEEKAYLARVAWRIAVDKAAQRGARAADELMDGLAHGGATPEQDAIASARRELLMRLIDGLPEELRQPLVLGALEEMNSREVGLAMGIPEGTVRTRMMRARAELKKSFDALLLVGKTAAAGKGAGR
jgi:RNA polymerase sigma-70 factor, ECF subfamily